MEVRDTEKNIDMHADISTFIKPPTVCMLLHWAVCINQGVWTAEGDGGKSISECSKK